MTILQTARLTLRPQAQADAAPLFNILNDPEAMRFWSRPPLTRLEIAEALVREQQEAMAAGLCRYWTAWEGDDAIGSLDLSLIENGSAELGFLLRRDRWGQGLASEAAAAIAGCGFGPMGLARLAAAVQVENRAAARVLTKTGFTLTKTHAAVALPGGARRDCAFYVRNR
jgi:ribosomal-protein-alanine N-acetyltransferase